MQTIRRLAVFTVLTSSLFMASTAQAVNVQVTVENLTPEGGVFNTPVWIGFHDGTFDLYDVGTAATIGLERLAEDGSVADLSMEFMAAQPTGQEGLVLDPPGFAGAPVFDPGNTSSLTVDVDAASNPYFSYATMVIPSNDAFVANGDPMAHRLFDNEGNFLGPISFVVFGNQVRDAGTEDNTEEDAAFLNQMGPNTGVTSNGVVSMHPGFNGSVANPDGAPQNILGGTAASGDVIDTVEGDFSRPGYQLLRITITDGTTPVRLTVKNRAPADGVYFTPVWVGFHDGSFDSYDRGELSSAELERLAEDGATGPISDLFAAAVPSGQDATVVDPEGFGGAPLFDPQSAESMVFNLDSQNQRYFSYISMVIPSNDAFIANGDQMAHRIFNEDGSFAGPVSIRVMGSDVLDAGTELNNETDAAFFDQTAPDTGTTTMDGIAAHPGFNGSVGNPDGTPQNILGGTNGPGIFFDETAADFSIPGYELAEITISRMVDGSFSGTWYDMERDGEGILMEISSDESGNPIAVVSWYTYQLDDSGEQLWLMGSGPVVGDTAFVEVYVTSGAQFGAGFDPADVVLEHWGQLQLKFVDCGLVILSYTADDQAYGMGEMELSRLTNGPIDYPGACQ